MKLKIRDVKLFLMLLIICSSLVSAISTESQQAQDKLAAAEKGIAELQAASLGVLRYNDTLFVAQQYYQASLEAEENGQDPDYSQMGDKVDELKEIKRNALKTLDELNALELSIQQVTDLDLDPIWEMYRQAEEELKSERYEKSLELIDATYEKMSELRAVDTKLKTFYAATSRGIVNFFKNWWKEVLIGLIVLVVISLIFYNRLSRYFIKRKIIHLEHRRKSVQNLIAETQEEYFDKNVISESNYQIKIRKYAELIREINRQIPLLREKIALQKDEDIAVKIEKKKKRKNKKSTKGKV